jgi:hypothetical protein
MQIEINRIEYEEMETRETMDFDAFKNFSNKIKWINLFFIITVVAMHCVREWETCFGRFLSPFLSCYSSKDVGYNIIYRTDK